MVSITNAQIKDAVKKSYLRRITTGKLDTTIDKNPGVLITGLTGSGKSSSVYQAAEELAELFGKRLFIYGKDKIEVDVDELAYKYKKMYDKIRRITTLVFNEKEGAYEIDREILASIVRDTFMDMTLDELFEMLDAISTSKIRPPKELFDLRRERNEIIRKIASGEYTEEDLDRLDEIEQKISEYKNAGNGLFVLVDFDLNQVESVDMTGVIVKTNIGFRYLPPLWALLLKRHGGILFLDEFTNIESNEKRSVAYRITFSKKVGEIFLDRHTLVVAAGNTTQDSSIAGELPLPLMNRFAHFSVDVVSKDGVINYFIRKYGKYKAALKVISFLAASSDSVLMNLPKSDTKETLRPFETPRAWEFVIRDLIALNGEIDPDSEETKLLLDMYGLKPGELVDKAQGNHDIARIVAEVASEYVSQHNAETLATQWIDKVLSPEELVKDPELFRKLYGNTGANLSMAALQTVFMYAQWMSTEMKREIEALREKKGGKRRHSKSIMNEIQEKILPKYMKPIKVIADVNLEYLTFLIGLVSSMGVTVGSDKGSTRGVPIHVYLVIGLSSDKKLSERIERIVEKTVLSAF